MAVIKVLNCTVDAQYPVFVFPVRCQVRRTKVNLWEKTRSIKHSFYRKLHQQLIILMAPTQAH